MSRNPVTIGPAEAITAAGDKMLQERVSCLPVVDDRERVVGIVTVRDFVKWSVGESHAREVESKHGEQGQGILIIIDGRRCYSPDAELSRLIRETEKLHNATEGFDSAQVPLLHTVSSN